MRNDLRLALLLLILVLAACGERAAPPTLPTPAALSPSPTRAPAQSAATPTAQPRQMAASPTTEPTEAPVPSPTIVAVAPTPAASTGRILRVTERRSVQLRGTIILSLSPDGGRLAAVKGGQICSVVVASLKVESCARIPDGHPDPRSVAWSPDGTRLAFTENLYQYLEESDIWVLEAASGKLRNLTDDRATGAFLSRERGGKRRLADSAPAWSPDGRSIVFARGLYEESEAALYTVPAGGGKARKLATATREHPFAVYYGIQPSPDGETVLFTLSYDEARNPENGVWFVRRGGEPRQLVGGDPERAWPLAADVAWQSGRALLFYPLVAMLFDADPADVWSLLDLRTGRTAPIRRVARERARTLVPLNVALAPDGSGLLYTLDACGETHLIHRDLATGRERVLFSRPARGRFSNTTEFGGGLDWARDDTVWVADGPGSGYVLQMEGK